LIAAPAGFGKSTLVSNWLAESDGQAAWLSLDRGDNDPVKFWTYVIAAIQTVDPQVGDEARQIMGSPQLRSTEPAVVSLVNDISQLDQELILILDDYHLIEAEQIHGGVGYLLGHQSPNLHLVLITRANPPLPMARLRAHGRLVEIRALDLQFSTDEAGMLFNDMMALGLEPNQIADLNERTEGWIVGLQLACMSLQGRPSYQDFIEQFTGSHQFILDYLTEEVLSVLPAAYRQFLLRTSILDRFCAALCAAITGQEASQQVLDDLRSSSLFLIPLDAGGTWFRYHHLFAEVLKALLERDHPGEVDGLHLKAAAWFESEGLAGEAVDHGLLSGDMVRARELFLEHWVSVLHRGEIATVLGWLNALPDEMKRDDPVVALANCWALFLSGQGSAIEPQLEQATSAYERLVDDGALSGAQKDLVAAQLAMMRSVLARGRGDHARSLAHAEEAARLMRPETLDVIGTGWNMIAAARAGAGDFEGAIAAYERGIGLAAAEGNLVGAYVCTYGQAMYLLVQGRLKEAEALCRRSIEGAVREGHGEFPAAGSLYVAMARIGLEQYQLDDAEAQLSIGLRVARPGGFGEAVRTGRYIRAQLAAARGDLDKAEIILQETERILNHMDDPYLTGELSWQWAAHYLRVGDAETARDKLQILEEMTAATQHANLLLWQGWLLPRLLCAEERFEQALAALDESIGRVRVTNSHGELIHLLALQAVALDALGRRMPARSALREALALSGPEGYIWRWLDAGPRIEPLLRDLRADRDTSQSSYPYLDSLLAACRDAWPSALREPARTRPGELPDPLTPRELEIMRLITKGYSNPEIAGELVVSTNTIKKHTSNIYAKLGVRSRAQAIARAHELNLL
jgi:LuxR family maltose regulon positive regulatory protein